MDISTRDISHWIDRWADFTPQKTAIRFEGAEISYEDFAAAVHHLAGALAGELGIKPGDRVAHLGHNSPQMLYLLFACARVRAMFMPLNWRLAAPEHSYMLADAAPVALFADSQYRDHLDRISGVSRRVLIDGPAGGGWHALDDLVAGARDHRAPGAGLDDRLLLVYTSGTTGRPKGAVLKQNAVQWNAINSAIMHEMTARDHIFCTLPLFHVGGMNNQTTPAFHAGATVTLHRRFDVGQTLRTLNDDRPDLCVLVPAQSQALVDHPAWPDTDVSSLRMITTGSSIVPEAMIHAWHDRGIPLVQIYGSTETCPIAIHNLRHDAFECEGSTGKPAMHCQIRLVGDDDVDVAPGETGEILVRGPNVFSEYWGNPQATKASFTADGWYRSGDVAWCDERGFYYVVERKKDMIISGAENIYPAEVEAVMLGHEGVGEVAIVGRRDERWGEVPVAFVVAAPQGAKDAAAILAFLEGRLARYKHPHEVIFVDELPRNALGKVRKFELRDRLCGD